MNIQQMRYVHAIADYGSFREAAKKLYVSQPSLSQAIKELESELDVQLFERTSQGTRLTSEGSDFLQHAHQILSQVDLLENRFFLKEDQSQNFSLASQHYDFISVIVSQLMKEFPDCTSFRLFENTTLNVIKDVEQYRSEFGILYLNQQNQAGLTRLLEGAQLEYQDLGAFHPHVFVRKDHPLAKKTQISLNDLTPYSQVRFLQEEHRYSFFSEDLIDFPETNQVLHVSDRGTMIGILQRTNSYGTGSGIVDNPHQQGLALIPLTQQKGGQIILIKKKDRRLSRIGNAFLKKLIQYLGAFNHSL